METVTALHLLDQEVSRRVHSLAVAGVHPQAIRRPYPSFCKTCRISAMATLSVVVPCFNEQATIGAILDAVRAVAKRDIFATRVKSGRSFNMFDKVNGTDSIRRDLAAGRSGAAIIKSWAKDEARFRQQRAKYLLYR